MKSEIYITILECFKDPNGKKVAEPQEFGTEL